MVRFSEIFVKIPKISWECWLKTFKSHQTIIIIIKITKLMAIHISWFNLWDQILSALTIIPHRELRSHFWVILRMEWSLQEKFDRSWPHSTFNVHGGSIFELCKGRIGEMNEHNKTYIDHLYLMSPEGAHLNFNTSGVLLHGEF